MIQILRRVHVSLGDKNLWACKRNAIFYPLKTRQILTPQGNQYYYFAYCCSIWLVTCCASHEYERKEDACRSAVNAQQKISLTSQRNSNHLNMEILEDGKRVFQFAEECPICTEKYYEKAVINSCQHEFCFGCVLTWAEVIIIAI
jgi:hypothetical protein